MMCYLCVVDLPGPRLSPDLCGQLQALGQPRGPQGVPLANKSTTRVHHVFALESTSIKFSVNGTINMSAKISHPFLSSEDKVGRFLF